MHLQNRAQLLFNETVSARDVVGEDARTVDNC
jgi:hypothetical protein